MIERVEKIIAELSATRADRRVHLFDVKPEIADSATTLKLTGKVLENADLQAILAKLPGVNIDSSGVKVLRREPRTIRYVATNLTDLHREPSWISELMTQFTNGEALEILEEKDRWCFVRTEQGYLGWVYKPYLTDKPPEVRATHIARRDLQLRSSQEMGPYVTRLSQGTRVHLLERYGTLGAHVRVCAGETPAEGWVLLPAITPLQNLPLPLNVAVKEMIETAQDMIGTHYLWGGTTANGIDCSGLCQLVHRLAGYIIPRDADMQFAAGKVVEPPYKSGDLMFFGGEPAAHAPRKITHVALSLGGWRIIHSSRSNNGVYEDDIQSVEHLRSSFCGARTFLR